MNTKLFQKYFICSTDWSVEDLNTMLDLALRLKGEVAMGVTHDHILRAKTLYMLFFEESTRTELLHVEQSFPNRRIAELPNCRRAFVRRVEGSHYRQTSWVWARSRD